MTKELVPIAACGLSIDSAIIFAEHPDEMEEADEALDDEIEDFPVRTFVLKILGDSARVDCIIPHRINNCWQSSNGNVYATLVNEQGILIYSSGKFSLEPLNVDITNDLRRIWGISGAVPVEDIVFALGQKCLFVRKKGEWKQYVFPQHIEMATDLCGNGENELYITTEDSILLFNGDTFEEMDVPANEEPHGILVRDDEMLITCSTIYSWDNNESVWVETETPLAPSIAMSYFDDEVYIGSLNGVMRLQSGIVEQVASFKCNSISNVGDGLLAFAKFKPTPFLFTGQVWSPIQLPAFPQGKIF
jgi:hypothetical protein